MRRALRTRSCFEVNSKSPDSGAFLCEALRAPRRAVACYQCGDGAADANKKSASNPTMKAGWTAGDWIWFLDSHFDAGRAEAYTFGMRDFITGFLRGIRETPRGYFLPAIWVWRLLTGRKA